MITDEYVWLKDMLYESFGKDCQIEEKVEDFGKTLAYFVTGEYGRNVLIVAEQIVDGTVIIGDYEIEQETGPLQQAIEQSNYRLNDDPNKIEQMKEIIRITREAWSKPKEGNNGKVLD